MNYRSIVPFFCFFVFTLIANAQYQKRLLSIISSSDSIDRKQQLINRFFESSTDSIPLQELADCYHDCGYKWYYKRWKKEKKAVLLTKSIKNTEEALALKRKLPEIDAKSIKKTLYNLGFLYSKQQRYFDAIDIYDELITIPPLDKKTLSSYRAQTNAYINIGDFDKALATISQLINLTKQDTLHKERLVQAYLKRLDIYSLKGYKKYEKDASIDLKLVDQLLKKHSFKKKKYYNRYYGIKGKILSDNNEKEKAIDFFEKILLQLPPEDSLNFAITYNNIGSAYLGLQQYSLAESKLLKASTFTPKFTAIYENLGDLFLAKKQHKKALLHYQKAIDLSVANSADSKYDSSIKQGELEIAANKYDLLHHILQKAQAWVTYYHYDKDKKHLFNALKTFKMADLLVDIIRFESSDYKSKLYWREIAATFYMKAVEACFLLKKTQDAYYYMEKSKAILLLEDVTHEQAKKIAKIPNSIAKKEYALKQKIQHSEAILNQLSLPLDASSIIVSQKEVYTHKIAYQRFMDSLHQKFPSYILHKQKANVMPYSQFSQKYMLPKKAVLHYILNDQQGYGILSVNAHSYFFKIENASSLQKDIIAFRNHCKQWFSTQEDFSSFNTISNRIFNQLIPENIYPLLKDKEITIIPDYTIQQIPFEVLNTSAKKQHYLIEDLEIKYAYSISYLNQNNLLKRSPVHDFLGIAPVQFNSKQLDELYLSKKEVTTIASLFSGATLLEEKATTRNFLDIISDYKILHLSTHADVGNDTMPWIALNDSILSLDAIYASKNQSDMVVLSACKTSLGTLRKGEGVMSLARAFFHSGSKSVVSSLWATNDKANQELMIDFYKGLNRGLKKSTALRNAKLNYIKTHQGSELSPFYWAGLILIGDDSMIVFPNEPLYLKYWYYILLGIVLALFILVKINKKKN